jgi:hypothetical protein
MSVQLQIAKQLRDVYFGGNWTAVNFTEVLKDISWQQATRKVNSFNTIATLVFHSGYYVEVLVKAMKGENLSAKDEYSFHVPPIESEADWNNLLDTIWKNAREAVALIELLPDEKLSEIFFHEKYGTWYRNLHGTIEHLHYHLGQIVLLKKLLND